jgi:small subunit ribosomal protein S17
MKNTKNETNCSDKKCSIHGKINARGRTLTGKVTKTSTSNTAKIEYYYYIPIKKYERVEKRLTKLHVHNPECIGAKAGDKVKIMETRKISKTKNFVITQKI